ncbi:hypothetical protein AEP_00509 [Curvibacter sp. AEP1-3]|uniref:hypothetical protein n=1 Tax=Curvibacter sp. AEP1-3 TaxID=1844971 RepID=UPI000B3D4DD4|nr:hypothetical protein [Curvibacter sp. AEP1-3]ARV17469.1 hypothetical protein AEP_00509 [Curvibacter sp. AEP1-3]
MTDPIQLAHWLAGIVVLAEALNKLERTAPFASGLSPRKRVVDFLKALAWLLLAIGAGGAVATPLLLAMGIHATPFDHITHAQPTFAETAVLLGFAVLIVRTRVKEG